MTSTAASETARRLKETAVCSTAALQSSGEDVIAAVQKETDALAAKQAETQPAPEETAAPDAAEKTSCWIFCRCTGGRGRPLRRPAHRHRAGAAQADPAQELAGYIRSRSAAALVTSHALLVSEVENADELLAQMPEDPQCADIVSRAGAKDAYYYSSANMSDNYAMIAQLIEDKDLCVMVAEMVRFNARVYPSATPLRYFRRSPYDLTQEAIEQTWQSMQGKPEYADIEELTNNQNERFLFSTQHLTRRYAKAISDVDEWTD